MLRGSSDMLQRSARHRVPLIGTIAEAPSEVWDLDLDGYDTEGIDLATALRSTFVVRSTRSKHPTFWTPR